METKGILIATGIFPPEIGGPASYSQTLAIRLSQFMPVAVVTYSKKIRVKSDKELPYRVFRVPKFWGRGLRHLFYFFSVFKYASNFDTILALNAVSAGVPARITARLRKKKFFVKIVGDYAWEIAIQTGKTSLLMNDFQQEKHSGKIKRLQKLQSQVAKSADRVIVPSEYLAGIVRGWGVDPNKIHVIYNGVDFKPSLLSKEESRKKLGITGNIIITAGRMVPWKGFRMLIKIMPKLFEVNQFFRLIIVGDGPDRHVLEAMVKNLNLDRKVYLVGQKKQSELAEYLAASDIFVLNSGYEGFSHQILEAMVAGVPVIVSAAGGNREIIHQGENGFMVKYNDEFNLVEAVRTLWNNPDLRERFIEEGKKAVGYFNVEKMFDETIKILTHV